MASTVSDFHESHLTSDRSHEPSSRRGSVIRDWRVECRLRDRASGYFGRGLRRARVVNVWDLALVRESDRLGALSDEQWAQLLSLDILLRGYEPGGDGDRHKVLIAIEASSVIDEHNVEQADTRAAILRGVG